MPTRKLARKKEPKTVAQQDVELVTQMVKRENGKTKLSENLRVKLPSGVRKGKRGYASKYDWDACMTEFMTSQPALNLKQVALRHGIPYGLVRNRAAKERWSVLRQQEQIALLKDNRQDFQLRMAKEAISFDETSIDVAKLGQGIIAGRLMEIARMVAAAGDTTNVVIEKLRAGLPLERKDLYSIVNYKELVSLAQAAAMFQEIGRKALGSDVVDGTILQGEAVTADLEKVVSIGGELSKDDPNRLAAFLEALERAGITSLEADGEAAEEDTEDVQVIEGQLIKPGEGQPALPATITTMEGRN